MTASEFILRFASENPLTALVAVCLVYFFVTWPFRLANRWIRHRNIKASGWPPPYMDADGDHHLKGEAE